MNHCHSRLELQDGLGVICTRQAGHSGDHQFVRHRTEIREARVVHCLYEYQWGPLGSRFRTYVNQSLIETKIPEAIQ